MYLTKNKTLALFIVLIIILLFTGCEKKFDSVVEYEKYILNSDSHSKNITKNGIQLTVVYMPLQAMMIRPYKEYLDEKKLIESDNKLSEKHKSERLKAEQIKLESSSNSYKNYIYFHLIIKREDGKDILYDNRNGMAGYSELVKKMLFQMDHYIYISTTSIEELKPSMTYMDQNYGLTHQRDILIQFSGNFDGEDLRKNSNIKFNIKELGLGTGDISFDFDISQKEPKLISNVPVIK